MGGLIACEPLGRSSTEPLPFWPAVIEAPPLSVQPVPPKEPADSPGASVYQLLSPAESNGWVRSGSMQEAMVPHVMPLMLSGAACAGPADRNATAIVRKPHRLSERERRRILNCLI